MGEKWEVPISPRNGPELDLMTADGSIVFIDTDNQLISLLDNNGIVRWSHEFSPDSSYPQIYGNSIYFVNASSNGNFYLNCISLDGVWASSTPCPPIYNFFVADDGRIYGLHQVNNESISSIYSIEGGSVIWNLTEKGSLGVIKVWTDGRVLIKHTDSHLVTTNITQTIVVDTEEMIMMDPNGTPEWRLPFPQDDGYYYSGNLEITSNGTIVLSQFAPGWLQTHAYNLSGSLLWTSNGTYDSSDTSTYFGCQQRASDGQHKYVEQVYKVDRANDSNSWVVYLNDTWGGTMYELNGSEIFVSSDGQAFCFDLNGSILWHIDTEVTGTVRSYVDPNLGVLVQSDNTVTMINKDGSFWTYGGIASSIMGGRFGPNNTVFVLTNDKLIVLYKPTVSMPSEYLIAMISVDLLVSLSVGLWIADRLIKKTN
jgi:outer membrane protein assembly factor BamB